MDARQRAREFFEDPDNQAELRRRKDADFFENSLPASTVFGQRLREARESRGFTQEELAALMRRIGNPMTKTAIGSIERGDGRRVTLDEALAFCEALSAVPAFMLTPPEGKLVRLNEGYAVGGPDVRRWLSSGLFGRSHQAAPEEHQDTMRWEAFASNVSRLARALLDAALTKDKEATNDAVKAIVLEVNEYERARPRSPRQAARSRRAKRD